MGLKLVGVRYCFIPQRFNEFAVLLVSHSPVYAAQVLPELEQAPSTMRVLSFVFLLYLCMPATSWQPLR